MRPSVAQSSWQALRQALAASEDRVKAERKRARRDKKTTAQRARQAERSNGKAAARKRKTKRSHPGDTLTAVMVG